MQEKCNSFANALELHLSCTKGYGYELSMPQYGFISVGLFGETQRYRSISHDSTVFYRHKLPFCLCLNVHVFNDMYHSVWHAMLIRFEGNALLITALRRKSMVDLTTWHGMGSPIRNMINYTTQTDMFLVGTEQLYERSSLNIHFSIHPSISHIFFTMFLS